MTALLPSCGKPPLQPGRQRWRADDDGPAAKLAAAAAVAHAQGAAAWRAVLAAALITALVVLLHPGARYTARETARSATGTLLGGQPAGAAAGSGGAARAADGSTFRRAAASAGDLCRLEYSVKTWDGNDALVCDPRVCAGREALRQLGPGTGSSARRWSARDEAEYMKLFNANQIQGWLQPQQLRYIKALTAKQHSLGIFGTVGEIGVHHGKFLIPIVGNALAAEPAVALDLFEAGQSANVDASGHGSKAQLLRNLERSGIAEDSIKLIAGNSMRLSAANFTAARLPAFRLLSVDGGHTLEVTLHDLMVASCVVRDGGLVILDDFPHQQWLGVAEALMHFAHAQDRLVPFMHGHNKVYFTTRSHVTVYQQLLAAQPAIFTCTKDHPSKTTIAGHKMCWNGWS